MCITNKLKKNFILLIKMRIKTGYREYQLLEIQSCSVIINLYRGPNETLYEKQRIVVGL